MSPLSWISLPPPTPSHPSRLSQRLFALPAWHCKSPVATYFTFGNVCFRATLSMRPSISFPHWVHKSVLCVCLSTASCRQVHQCHLSRFHIYVLIYSICFSLFDLLAIMWISLTVSLFYTWQSQCLGWILFQRPRQQVNSHGAELPLPYQPLWPAELLRNSHHCWPDP